MKGLIASMFTLSLFYPLRSSLHAALGSVRLGVHAFAEVGFRAVASALFLTALAEKM
jgi:hypothetical protein